MSHHRQVYAPCRNKLEELLDQLETAEQTVTLLQQPHDGSSAVEGIVHDPSAAAALAWLESLSEEGR